MKHLTTKFIAALFGWILLGVIALAWTPASAQTITKGYTACGAEATGKDRTQGGKSVTAKLPRQFVGPDGYWHTCQPWVADGGDPAMPEPKPELACPAETHYRAWEVDGVQCTSIPPGESTDSTLMLRRTPAGPAASGAAPAGAGQAAVLADVLGECGEAVRRVAAEADHAINRGRACEAAYQSLTKE